MVINSEKKKKEVENWFKELRNAICESFEEIERKFNHKTIKKKPGKFNKVKWERLKNKKGGGGEMAIMKGRIFEKVGVNISTVYGTFSKEFRKQVPGCKKSGNFWASGISLVAHLHSPFITAAHFNTRHIITSKSWFGGGTDITPAMPDKKNINFFHNSLKQACSRHNQKYYPKFKKWCNEYFYLKHRNETRGAGGIFFDYLNTKNWGNDFNFLQDVGECFLETYPKIIKNNIHKSWTKKDREKLLIKRGRYAEFNLLYDRGTQFGLKTGGNVDAILMSMPPEAKWL
jgi:coproporphyrinogen III oxidase